MLPIIEIRGAIPTSQVMGLPLFQSIIVSIIGNLLPIPIVYFFSKKILIWGSDKKYIGKIFKKFLDKGHNAGEKILEKGESKVFLALMLFVAIPFPATGAYTGALASTILDLDFKKSFLSISLGVIISGIIIISLTYLFKIIVF